eukprot:6953475-Prorocentrum_lima.AAC.1
MLIFTQRRQSVPPPRGRSQKMSSSMCFQAAGPPAWVKHPSRQECRQLLLGWAPLAQAQF